MMKLVKLIKERIQFLCSMSPYKKICQYNEAIKKVVTLNFYGTAFLLHP